MSKKNLLTTTAERQSKKVKISVFDYDGDQFTERDITSEECVSFKEKPTITWINVDGIYDPKIIEKIGDCYGLSKAIQEQILDTTGRPKIEDLGGQIFIILKMFLYNKDTSKIISEQVSMVIGRSWVITFQERGQKEDVFDPVRKRIRTSGTKIRRSGTDYLAYRLIDSIVDNYFFIVEILGDEIEKNEDETLRNPCQKTLHIMQKIRKEILYLRKSIWPVREILNSLQRGESILVSDETRKYLRDLYDHTVQIIDAIETTRDTLSYLLDIYLSSISNKLNEVMKVLTMISTIFMPLTFLVGVYGMNFKHFPELDWKYGYLMVWIVMFIIAGIMAYIFRRRKWL
ncbi:magnesium/cobalt transporter CorA [Candidatus Saganbacteria bacterium]|nr:magnesium/cobalt transporter CorA [Candidatus Saganbacteria bacterium]